MRKSTSLVFAFVLFGASSFVAFVTGAQYNADDPAGDLTAFWGDGPTPVAFAIGAAGGVAPVVPEPSGISLASLALLGLLGLRTRRK